jgi:hypothetical protein
MCRLQWREGQVPERSASGVPRPRRFFRAVGAAIEDGGVGLGCAGACPRRFAGPARFVGDAVRRAPVGRVPGVPVSVVGSGVGAGT